MACRAIVLALLATASVQAAVMRGANSASLATDGGERMRPDLVARTFANVEDEWRSQVSLFLECNASAPEGKGCRSQQMTAFSTSCAKVVDAIVSGSDGDRDNAREYMNDVCAQSSLTDWKQSSCKELAVAVFDYGMNANSYANRQMFKSTTTCAGFFSTFLDAEEKRKTEEAKVRAEQEKKAAEEAAVAKKKAEEEAEVAKKKAEEEAKVEAARLEKEREVTAKAAEEKAADEAKAKAAEAAERMAQKKAEAEQMQQEAQKKLDEAAKAEEENTVALANHQKAQQLFNNATHVKDPVANLSLNVANNTAISVLMPNATASNKTQLETVRTASEQLKNTSESLVVNATK